MTDITIETEMINITRNHTTQHLHLPFEVDKSYGGYIPDLLLSASNVIELSISINDTLLVPSILWSFYFLVNL